MRRAAALVVAVAVLAGCTATPGEEAAVGETTTSPPSTTPQFPEGTATDSASAESATTTTTVAPSTTSTSTTSTTTTTTTTTTLVPPDGLTAAERTLEQVTVIGGTISPKSVVASGTGLFFAQNMMYRHTVTVYDRSYELVATIPDDVDLGALGFAGYEGRYQGAPVEAAFTSDGAFAYVSNYEMYGAGRRTGAGDSCSPGQWQDSFVYRIDAEALGIDRAIPVGAVPKYLAVTPDDRLLVVSNWCSYDLSVVDLARDREVARIDIGRYPRGIAISPDSSTAYVAVMGSNRVAVVDLETLAVVDELVVGSSPRHLVLSPEGDVLYVSLNREGRLAKVDLATGEVLAKVATGVAPRSMDISDDGTALYVVNYESGTMSKVRTADMVETQELGAGYHPIGITYDAATREVWVSAYGGTITVFVDTAP